MKNNEPGKQSSFEFNEQGTAEVSEQIMNAYNSGFINREGLLGDLNELGDSHE